MLRVSVCANRPRISKEIDSRTEGRARAAGVTLVQGPLPSIRVWLCITMFEQVSRNLREHLSVSLCVCSVWPNGFQCCSSSRIYVKCLLDGVHLRMYVVCLLRNVRVLLCCVFSLWAVQSGVVGSSFAFLMALDPRLDLAWFSSFLSPSSSTSSSSSSSSFSFSVLVLLFLSFYIFFSFSTFAQFSSLSKYKRSNGNNR